MNRPVSRRQTLAGLAALGALPFAPRAAMAEHRGDPLWEAKLARFFAVSEEFKTLWHQRNDVRGVENQLKLFTHPELGDFTLQQMYWYSAPRNGSRLLVYLPVDEAGERAMAWLAEQAK